MKKQFIVFHAECRFFAVRSSNLPLHWIWSLRPLWWKEEYRPGVRSYCESPNVFGVRGRFLPVRPFSSTNHNLHCLHWFHTTSISNPLFKFVFVQLQISLYWLTGALTRTYVTSKQLALKKPRNLCLNILLSILRHSRCMTWLLTYTFVLRLHSRKGNLWGY